MGAVKNHFVTSWGCVPLYHREVARRQGVFLRKKTCRELALFPRGKRDDEDHRKGGRRLPEKDRGATAHLNRIPDAPAFRDPDCPQATNICVGVKGSEDFFCKNGLWNSGLICEDEK